MYKLRSFKVLVQHSRRHSYWRRHHLGSKVRLRLDTCITINVFMHPVLQYRHLISLSRRRMLEKSHTTIMMAAFTRRRSLLRVSSFSKYSGRRSTRELLASRTRLKMRPFLLFRDRRIGILLHSVRLCRNWLQALC